MPGAGQRGKGGEKVIAEPRRWLAQPRVQLFLLLTFSLVYRGSTFGHPNMDSDEAFYLLIGQSMHTGMVPYVDIWDRKPFGLFALFYLFAAIDNSVLVYQIAACLFVGATAWVIGLITAEFSGSRGSLMAGGSYILLLPLFLGWGGQAPVFYNLFVASAALLVIRSLHEPEKFVANHKIDFAMFLCGIAITFKQTALFESAFFGLFCTYILIKNGKNKYEVARMAIRWMLLGAAPTIAIGLSYFWIGHWNEYWQAMFTSNLAKQTATPVTLAARAINTYLRLFPLLCASLLGLLLKAEGANAHKRRTFLIGWIVSAWIGFLIVPNLYPHYVLPLLVSMSVAAGLLFSRRDLGLILFLVLSITSIRRYSFNNFERTPRAENSINAMANSIRAHDAGRGLLIFDGPILLYSLTQHRPMTPLALPLHLNYAIEENVSHLNTNAEVARVLALRPGVVLMADKSRNNPPNLVAKRMVDDYVKQHCRLVDRQWSSEMFRSDVILVYGDCGKVPR